MFEGIFSSALSAFTGLVALVMEKQSWQFIEKAKWADRGYY